MCDKIKEDDDRMKSTVISNNPCINKENKILDDCLKLNNHDWRLCNKEIKALQECFKLRDDNKLK